MTNFDIRDWPRGTNQPLTVTVTQAGKPYPLTGCVLAFALRDKPWEDSKTDTTAIVKKRVKFYEVYEQHDVNSIPSPQAGDIAYAGQFGRVLEYDGSDWNESNIEENNPKEGRYTFRVPYQDMLVPVGDYYYSVVIRFANGEVAKLLGGRITVTENTVNEVV